MTTYTNDLQRVCKLFLAYFKKFFMKTSYSLSENACYKNFKKLV